MLHVPHILYRSPFLYEPSRNKPAISVESFYSPILWISNVHSVIRSINGHGSWLIKLPIALASCPPNSQHVAVTVKLDYPLVSLIDNVNGIISSDGDVAWCKSVRRPFPLSNKRSIGPEFLHPPIQDVSDIDIPLRIHSYAVRLSEFSFASAWLPESSEKRAVR